MLVAMAVGLDNFAASLGMGIAGVDRRLRLRVAVVFGFFEAAMPLAGLALGRQVAHELSGVTNYVGGGLLIAAASYAVIMAVFGSGESESYSKYGATGGKSGLRNLVIMGVALSIDNLVVGFALGTYRVSLPVAATVIGAVSVGLSMIGLELGSRIGKRLDKSADLVGGTVLMVVGAAIAAGIL